MSEDDGLANLISGVKKRDPFAERRSYAYGLMKQGSDASPVQSPWQGAARLAQAVAGGLGVYYANKQEADAGEAQKRGLADAMAKTDPHERMAALTKIFPDIGVRAAATSAADEIKLRRQRADDGQAAGFLIPDGAGMPQADGAPQAGAPPQAAPNGSGVNSNNIGNVRPVGSSTGFQQPQSFADGVNLAVNNARAYPAAFNGGQPMNLMQIGSKWAPKGDGANDPAQWARNVASIGGLDPNQPLDLNHPPTAAAFARGVHGAEHGSQVVRPIEHYGAVIGQPGASPIQQAQAQGPPPGRPPAPDPSVVGGPTIIAQGGGDQPSSPQQPPTQGQGGDPGAGYMDAARKAQAAGRGDIALKYVQAATAAREAAAAKDTNRTLQHVDLGDSIGVMDPRTGMIVQRIPKGTKPGEGGAFPGSGMDNQMRSALARGANDPSYAATPEYALAWGHLSKPRFDAQSGTTIPPEDLSRFRPPTYSHQGQPQAPQQPNGAPPPPTSDDFRAAPGSVAGQPQPGGIVATPVQGLPPKEAKPLTEDQAKSAGFFKRMAEANSTLDKIATEGASPRGRLLEAIPFGLGNFHQTPEYQVFEQNKRNFMNAELRSESGATIQASEFMSADKQYFPVPGDKQPVIAAKAENRRQVIEAMMVRAGMLKPGERYDPPKAATETKAPVDLKQKYGLE